MKGRWDPDLAQNSAWHRSKRRSVSPRPPQRASVSRVDESYIPPGWNLGRILKSVRHLKHLEICAMRPDNLKANRQSLSGESARYGDRRRPCQGDGVTGAHPIDISRHRLSIDLSDPFGLNRKRGDLRNR